MMWFPSDVPLLLIVFRLALFCLRHAQVPLQKVNAEIVPVWKIHYLHVVK